MGHQGSPPSSLLTPPQLEPLEGKVWTSLRAPNPQGQALTMFPANVPNYPPFGSVPGVETFQPEEAACFGKFLGEPPPPACRVPTLLYHWALRGAQSCAGLAPPRWPPLPGRCSLASPRSSSPPAPTPALTLIGLIALLLQVGARRTHSHPPSPLQASPVGVDRPLLKKGKKREPGLDECRALKSDSLLCLLPQFPLP